MHTSKKKTHLLKVKFVDRHKKAVNKLLTAHENVFKQLPQSKQFAIPELGTTPMQMLSAGLLSGALLLGQPVVANITKPAQAHVASVNGITPQIQSSNISEPKLKVQSKDAFVQLLNGALPARVDKLTTNQSEVISRIIKDATGINAVSVLNDISLPTDYGYIGYEQHLYRYPGDSAVNHTAYQSQGVAPKTGAWGYFSSSKNTLSTDLIEKEKYYFAVQTFAIPGWNQNWYQLKDWFKYRKMIVVNPKTGDIVVGVVADAGPAVWTGKQFGGSPEVMENLHLNTGYKKGDVILFFVDDPEDKIPLGPINLN